MQLSLFPTPSFVRRALHPRFPSRHSCLSIPFRPRPSQQILVAMTDNLVILAKHLLAELNIYNDGDGRADHPFQADFFKASMIFSMNSSTAMMVTNQIQPIKQRCSS
jgi:hypothetical protein